MDKLINQSIEDREINKIIRDVHSLKYSITLTEENWERRYQESLKYQKFEYDRYVERNGKPPMVFEDNPYYFLQIQRDHNIVISERDKYNEERAELLRLEEELGGKTWRYLVDERGIDGLISSV